jgi:hypothetical protein
MSTSIANLPKPVGGVCHKMDQHRLPLLGLICEVVYFCVCILKNAPFFPYLSSEKVVPPNGFGKPSILNGRTLNISKVLEGVMSSAAKAEIGAPFLNAKEAMVVCTTITELGHPQANPRHVE